MTWAGSISISKYARKLAAIWFGGLPRLRHAVVKFRTRSIWVGAARSVGWLEIAMGAVFMESMSRAFPELRRAASPAVDGAERESSAMAHAVLSARGAGTAA